MDVNIAPSQLHELSFNDFVELVNKLFSPTSSVALDPTNSRALLASQQPKEVILNIKSLSQAQIVAKHIANLINVSACINQEDSISSILMEVAINELLFNSVEHGLLHISYDLKTRLLANNQWEEYIQTALSNLDPTKVVSISFSAHVATSQQLLIKITDPGQGFDADTIKRAVNDTAQHGRGHMLIAMLKELKYHGSGNIVTFVIDYAPAVN